MDKLIIETERLILRDIEITDVKNFNILGNNKNVTKYLDYIKTNSPAETEKWIQQKIDWNNAVPRESFNFSIILKDTKEFIGWIGIGDSDEKEMGDMDFGYAILPQFQGKGYGVEVLKSVIDYCFKNLEINKIFGDCNKENIASRKVMEKVGMRFEKEVDGKVYLSIQKGYLRNKDL